MTVSMGLCSVAFRHLEPASVVDVAAAAGVRAIEWGGDVHVPPGDRDRASRVARLTSDAGIESASYGSYLRAGATTPAEVHRTVTTAVALGAPNLRIWTDWVGPQPAPAQRRRVIGDVRAVAAAAARAELTVSLEFHPHTLTETARSTLDLLEDVDAANVFTYWQPADDTPIDELLQSWRAVRQRVSHLHVFRWRSSEERWPLEAGADLWPAVLGSMPSDARWTSPRVAFIEFVRDDDPPQLLDDAATLERWIKGSSAVGGT